MSPETKTQAEIQEASQLESKLGVESRNVVLVSSSLVLLTSLAALLFDLVHTEHGRIIIMIAMALVTVSIFLAFRGILQPARIIAPTVAFVILTFFLVDGDGVHDASITAYAAVVILGGLLLGETGVIVFGSLTTISLAAIVYAEFAGISALQTKYSGLFDVIDVNTIWFLHLATSTIIYVLVRRLSRLANAAQIREVTLTETNKELSTLRDVLQERVAQRTNSLERQNIILQAAARVSNEVSTASDVNTLLQTSVELIASEFEYDHAAIFLLNENRDRAILQATSSVGGKKMLQERYELPVDERSSIGFVAKNKSPRIIFNEGSDAEFFANPHLSGMQSAISLPLIRKEEVLGVLDIQSSDAEVFTQGNIAIFQSMANQIALTIQNTRLIEEANLNLAQLELVVAEQSTSVWSEHLQQNSYGFIYTPLGVKPLRTTRRKEDSHPNTKKAEIPITLRGREIGSINIQRLSRQWTPKEKALLNDVAAQIGLAIENARLLYETREQAHQEQLVTDVSTKLRETLDMDTVLKTAIEEMKRTFNLREVEVRLSPDDSTEDA